MTKGVPAIYEVGARYTEAITFGDIHELRLKASVKEATWGKGGLVDQLRPRYQFIEDLLDFHSRSHHDIKDPFKMYERYIKGEDSVRSEVSRCGDFLTFIAREDCETIVVDSNHDRHLLKWLGSQDARRDPVNWHFWNSLTGMILHRIEHKQKFIPLQEAIGLCGQQPPAKFIDANTSFVICKEFAGGIECGMHGDQPWRASVGTFAKMGRRSNTAHGHVATIKGGAFRAGKSCEDRMDYNDGPSAWSDSHIVTYANSKRTIVTLFNGKARA